MKFIKKQKDLDIDLTNVPNHIAFICDGNRRWAKEHGLPKLLGHKEGVEAIKRVVKRAAELKIKNLTFFGFSTENFGRSPEEIDYLFNIFRGIRDFIPDFVRDGYRFEHIGDKSMLPDDLVKVLNEVTTATKAGTIGTIRIALAYGGRHDIVEATRKIISNNIPETEITEESFKKYLSTGDMPDVDLLVRASGENRISGFLLYNMAYAELYFVKKYWPAFIGRDVDDCIKEFQTRKRRFGK